MNFTTHQTLTTFTDVDSIIEPIAHDDCNNTNEFYIIGLTVLTSAIAFISECMSLSKCGGDSNGVIQAIKTCIKLQKNPETEHEDNF